MSPTKSLRDHPARTGLPVSPANGVISKFSLGEACWLTLYVENVGMNERARWTSERAKRD